MKQEEQDPWHQNIQVRRQLSKVTNLTMLYEPQAPLKSNRLFYRMGIMIFHTFLHSCLETIAKIDLLISMLGFALILFYNK